jgi:death-on-curing protein
LTVPAARRLGDDLHRQVRRAPEVGLGEPVGLNAVRYRLDRFGGEYLHPALAKMAAAYLFHICRNHAFNDGNKRVAVLSALIFLRAHGIERLPEPEDLEAVTLEVAAGERGKDGLTDWLCGVVGDHPIP